jgi:hypothetical protein
LALYTIKKWILDPNGFRYFLITGKAVTGKNAIVARLWWQISEGKVDDKNLKKD